MKALAIDILDEGECWSLLPPIEKPYTESFRSLNLKEHLVLADLYWGFLKITHLPSKTRLGFRLSSPASLCHHDLMCWELQPFRPQLCSSEVHVQTQLEECL